MNTINHAVAIDEETLKHIYSDEDIQRLKADFQRIDAINAFEENLSHHGEKTASAQCQIDLVHLIGPELATPFLQMFEPPIADDVVSDNMLSAEALYAKYSHDLNLMAALDRMMRIMVKLYGNGEGAVENIEKYGDVQGVALINAVTAQIEEEMTDDRKYVLLQLASASELPSYVMSDIHWGLEGFAHHRQDFNEIVHRHRLEICIDGYWDPDMVSILAPRIRVECMNWEAEDFNPTFEFESDNGLWFTEGELLFKIHNAVVTQTCQLDPPYFEGMSLAEIQEDGKPPLYLL